MKNFIADIFVGIGISIIGFNFFFRREKTIDALLSSNKVFWEEMGYTPNERRAAFLTQIMIPLMGALSFRHKLFLC